MNETTLSRLSGRYLAGLRSHIEQVPQAGMKEAHDLGSQAVADGLETLDLAKIHDQALATLLSPDSSSVSRDDMTTHAAVFFTEVIMPIEATHRAAREGKVQLEKLGETLDQGILDLADSNRELQQGITERKSAEAALKSIAEHPAQLLKESRLLEERLQEMARNILAANEAERKKMSLQLQDEIAQMLLGIQVRLLALKKEAENNRAGLTEEIAATQRLVEESMKAINRFTREFGIHHEG